MSRKPDIEVQRGVYVLIGVNELGTQSRVSVYIIYDLTDRCAMCGCSENSFNHPDYKGHWVCVR